MNEREFMLTALLRCERSDLYAKPTQLSAEQQQQLNDMKARRANGEPLQYILGTVNFLGLNLKVDERVLIPRPETEILVDLIVQKLSNKAQGSFRVLDLGTGSGNIAILLAKKFPNCHVTAVDISGQALTVAKENACDYQVSKRIDFQQRDMLEFFTYSKNKNSEFDVIVSNPPYVPSLEISKLAAEVQREPRIALDGGVDGLDYCRSIVHNSSSFLTDGGILALEIGDGQRDGVAAILAEHLQYRLVEFYKDHCGIERIVTTVFNSTINKKQPLRHPVYT